MARISRGLLDSQRKQHLSHEKNKPKGNPTMNQLYELIKDYVDDHYEYFRAYPMDVMVSTEEKDTIYSWDEYWNILDNGEKQ